MEMTATVPQEKLLLWIRNITINGIIYSKGTGPKVLYKFFLLCNVNMAIVVSTAKPECMKENLLQGSTVYYIQQQHLVQEGTLYQTH